MRGLAISLSLVSLGLVACDDGPSLEVTEEPAGVNCATGGFRIEADGVVFYSCEGQATTENVPAGAEGNPCFGAAIRVTIPVEGGATQYAYVCQSAEIDETATGVLLAIVDAQNARERVECACAPTPEDQADCESDLAVDVALADVAEGCVGDLLLAAGPLPSADRTLAECFRVEAAEAITCFDAIVAAECSAEVEAQQDACVEILDDITTACGTPSAELQQWVTRVQILGQFLGCPVNPNGGS